MSQSNHQKSIHKMQRYVVGGVVLMSTVALSFPIAMMKVSATKKFSGQAVKSQDCLSQTPKEQKVIEWAKDCMPLKVEPKKADAKPAEVANVAIVPSAQPVTAVPTAVITSPKPDESNLLKLGMSSEAVSVLQTKLQAKGVFSSEIDGLFGEDTEAAVRQLQTQMKLEPTGIADSKFQGAIEIQP